MQKAESQRFSMESRKNMVSAEHRPPPAESAHLSLSSLQVRRAPVAAPSDIRLVLRANFLNIFGRARSENLAGVLPKSTRAISFLTSLPKVVGKPWDWNFSSVEAPRVWLRIKMPYSKIMISPTSMCSFGHFFLPLSASVGFDA